MAVDVDQELEIIGGPIPDGINFQPSVTEVARDAIWLDNILLVLGTLIMVFVLGLLIYVILRFNASSNKTPSQITHNTPLEIIWTAIPIVILVGIGIISLPILFKQQSIPEGDVTIKATGNQWYWTYDYMDHDFSFDSFMLDKSALEDHGYTMDEFMLATDQPVVIPVDTTVVVYVTASDVIHAWTIPAFGVKQDGVPGRLAGLWFKAEKEGIYFGQCSELCGKDHTYMPITVKVVSQEVYDDWIQRAVAEFAEVKDIKEEVLYASIP
ncbi:MAG: cytochrome c oxidase subunit II [Rhodobacteraceae bacterium]|nr:cytochrome c oxidase subunit II [Paracoccaceae bacterium]MCY4249347.1 cytochrome c oxidase subunit II [Paracoccaceae bacterium]